MNILDSVLMCMLMGRNYNNTFVTVSKPYNQFHTCCGPKGAPDLVRFLFGFCGDRSCVMVW